MRVICPCHDNGPKANLKALGINPKLVWTRDDGGAEEVVEIVAITLTDSTRKIAQLFARRGNPASGYGRAGLRIPTPSPKIVVGYDGAIGLAELIADGSSEDDVRREESWVKGRGKKVEETLTRTRTRTSDKRGQTRLGKASNAKTRGQKAEEETDCEMRSVRVLRRQEESCTSEVSRESEPVREKWNASSPATAVLGTAAGKTRHAIGKTRGQGRRGVGR